MHPTSKLLWCKRNIGVILLFASVISNKCFLGCTKRSNHVNFLHYLIKYRSYLEQPYHFHPKNMSYILQGVYESDQQLVTSTNGTTFSLNFKWLALKVDERYIHTSLKLLVCVHDTKWTGKMPVRLFAERKSVKWISLLHPQCQIIYPQWSSFTLNVFQHSWH